MKKKVLVAYFSYSGTTKGVAEVLSGQIGADLFEIAPKEAYSSLYLQSNAEIRKGERPELSSTVENMEEYDFSDKTIIPFTTHGGSGFSRTIQTISELQPNATVISDGLSISRNSVSGAESDVVDWVNCLNLTSE